MEATKITKIEFDHPVVVHEGEKLVVQFTNLPDELQCKCVLVQKDGTVVPIGQEMEDVVLDNESSDTGEAEEEGNRRGAEEAGG